MKNYLIVILIVLGLLIVVKDFLFQKEEILLDNNATVLAFGDSLTYGFGSDKSYPDFFHEMTGLEVINAGVSGEISAEGVQRLRDYLAFEPDLVILCHGAKVLLVGVPEFNLLNMDAIDVYYELAKEQEVLLEDEIIGYIELRAKLKSDYVHPNEKGYKVMAESFVKVLKDNNYIE